MNDREYESWREEIEAVVAGEGPAAALERVRATRSEDDDARVRFREGVLLTQLGRWSEAVALLEPLGDDRDAMGMPEGAFWLLVTTQALANAGRPHDALPLAREAAADDLTARQGRLLLVQLQRMLGDERAEEELLRQEVDREDPDFLAAEAVRLWRSGEAERAEEIARRVVEIDPEHPQGLGLLGLAALARGELDLAREQLGTALARQPTEAAWARGAADAIDRSGDRAGAMALLRHALEHHPEGPGRDQLLEVLARLAAAADTSR